MSESPVVHRIAQAGSEVSVEGAIGPPMAQGGLLVLDRSEIIGAAGLCNGGSSGSARVDGVLLFSSGRRPALSRVDASFAVHLTSSRKCRAAS